jgi:glycosyltransferase involved in cell wall biosynthesis
MRPLAIIIPARNEASCIEATIKGLQAALQDERHIIGVGINGTTDDTAAIAERCGAVVGYAKQRGYGHGCMAAIQAISIHQPSAYIFCAADGAQEPSDILRLIAAHRAGANFVLGQRTRVFSNWQHGGWRRRLQNTLLGLWASLLTGHAFSDLGPLRVIEAELFNTMQLSELEYGWTIEAQLRAVQLRAKINHVPVREVERSTGEQKISGVSWRHSLSIGWHIVSAGWRTARTASKQTTASTGITQGASSHASVAPAS